MRAGHRTLQDLPARPNRHPGCRLQRRRDPLAPIESATGTVLTAPVPDQAALHGFIARIEGPGLELVELQRLPPGGAGNYCSLVHCRSNQTHRLSDATEPPARSSGQPAAGRWPGRPARRRQHGLRRARAPAFGTARDRARRGRGSVGCRSRSARAATSRSGRCRPPLLAARLRRLLSPARSRGRPARTPLQPPQCARPPPQYRGSPRVSKSVHSGTARHEQLDVVVTVPMMCLSLSSLRCSVSCSPSCS